MAISKYVTPNKSKRLSRLQLAVGLCDILELLEGARVHFDDAAVADDNIHCGCALVRAAYETASELLATVQTK